MKRVCGELNIEIIVHICTEGYTENCVDEVKSKTWRDDEIKFLVIKA